MHGQGVVGAREGLEQASFDHHAGARAAARAGIPYTLSTMGTTSIEDVKALLEPRAKKLAGAIAGRALYDGRLDPAAALTLIRNARAA